MKTSLGRAKRLVLLCSIAAAFLSVGSVSGQPFSAEVRGLLGQATVETKEGIMPLRVGMSVPAGTILQTGKRSAVELSLGKEAGSLRLTENTTLELAKLEHGEADGTRLFNVQLNLRHGSVLGTINRMTPSSKYHLKQPGGFAGLIGGEFRAHADGHFVLLDGAAILVTVPASGEPASVTLKAPPPSFFLPEQGVKPAPAALVKEVTAQLKAKLPKK
jgi:hypothetical protein